MTCEFLTRFRTTPVRLGSTGRTCWIGGAPLRNTPLILSNSKHLPSHINNTKQVGSTYSRRLISTFTWIVLLSVPRMVCTNVILALFA